MFELLIQAAKAVVESLELLNKLGKVRREALATYFDKTAKVMREYVEAIDRGEEPPPLCKKLEVIANNIQELSKTTLAEKEMDGLVSEMESVCSNWRKLDSSNQDNAKTNKLILREILSAAGYFEGEAIVLRAQ